MEIAYIINAIVMSLAVGLGLGGSTVAVGQFFAAISNGKIDESERGLMRVTYQLLRVAMGLILLAALVQFGIIYYSVQTIAFITPFFIALWITVAVLFINAVGMTYHWIPGSVGPAVQAGSWYTLGVLMALIPIGLTGFSLVQFALIYAGVILLAIAALNIVMSHLRAS